MTQAVLDLSALRVSFRARSTDVTALRDVSFQLQPGNTLALVGKSGSGKTTLGRTLLRLVEPSAGKTRYDGVDLNSLTPEQMRAMRQRMQITFQDPMSSLNPRLRVADIIAEGLVAHSIGTKPERCDRVAALLEEEVGLRADHMSRFAQEFSSGQRQRIGIARALALEPKFIVADESVSALDVSIQAQVLNLLPELRAKRNLTILFFAHDLSVMEYLFDQIVVMYLRKLVEIGPARFIQHRRTPIPRRCCRPFRCPTRAYAPPHYSARQYSQPACPAFGLRVPHPLPRRRRNLCRWRPRPHDRSPRPSKLLQTTERAS